MGSFPLFGSGKFFAANGSGIIGDPYRPIVAQAGSITGSFQAFDDGAYYAVSSGSGTKADPYIPLVYVPALNSIELESGLGSIELESTTGLIALE